MSAQRKRFLSWAGVGAGIGAAVLALAIWPQTRSVAALLPPEYGVLDPVAGAQVDRLRSDLGVDNDGLAALDPTSEQLETVLSQLRGWYEQRHGELVSRWRALADQRARIRLLRARGQQGEDVVSAVRGAQTALEQLESEYQTYLAAARNAIVTGLNETQSARFATMRGQPDLLMPYRALPLTSEQRQAVRTAVSRYRSRFAVPRVGDDLDALQAAFAQELAAAVGGANVQLLGELKQYLPDAAERTVAAVNYVLPVASDEDPM